MAEQKEDSGTMYYVIVAVILIIIIAIVLFWDKFKEFFKAAPGNTTIINTGGGGVSGTAPLNMDLMLKQGVTGLEVKQLQTWLGINADGVFGPVTETALYQKRGVTNTTLNLYASGIDLSEFVPFGYNVPATADDNLSFPEAGVMNSVMTNDISYMP